MTPSGWTPVHRHEDQELVGYLVTDARGSTPLTLFGYPLSEPVSQPEAEGTLRRRGLPVLADAWWLEEEDGTGFRVQILSATVDAVTVARADYGFVPPDTERRRLRIPVGDRLRPLAAR